MPLLELRLFGPGEVLVGGAPPPPTRTRKGLYLLALLALRAGREVPRDFLAATLWPESLEEQARSSLRRALTDLRQTLGPAAGLIESPTARTLLLTRQELDCDLIRFDSLAPAKDVERLEGAAALYRGPLLEGCAEEWALGEREARRDAYVGVRARLAEAARCRDDHPSAAAHLRAALAADPLREATHRALMESLAAAGDFAAAVQAYRDLRVLLRREWNAEPGPETAALFHRIRDRARHSAARPPAPVPMPPTPTPTSAPPPAAGTSPPRPLTALLGRQRECAEVNRLVRERRLVTLTGVGGIGKTRLAIAIAAEAAGDAARFVELAALPAGAGPEPITRAIADAVGATQEAGEEVTTASALGAVLAQRPLLLLLDNAEHLLDALVPLAGELLGRCPGLRILATSREPLGLPGEVTYAVPPLPVPEQDAAPADALRSDAVRLFLERAEAAHPGFNREDRHGDSLAAAACICRRLDGLPLAIELAASRITLLSAPQIAARLGERFRLLAAGGRRAPERHRTLRAALDWSYRLLTDEEQSFLRRLSVFAGPFGAEMARHVGLGEDAAEWDALDLLDALARKSLVAPAPPAGGPDAPPRFRLLETVREYAAERLAAAGETEETRRLLFGAVAAAVRSAQRRMGGPGQSAAQAELAAERDNLHAALDWCFAPGPADRDRETLLDGQRVVNALARHWAVRNRLAEGRAWCSRALAFTVPDPPGDESAAAESRRVRARLLSSTAILSRRQGDNAGAWALQQEALAAFRILEDPAGLSMTLGSLALLALNRGHYEESRTLREEGLAAARRSGNDHEVAMHLHNAANLVHRLGDPETARARYQECLDLYRRLGDDEGVSWAQVALAGVLRDLDAYAEASAAACEGLRRMRQREDREGEIVALIVLAGAAHGAGDEAAGRACLAEALSVLAGAEGTASLPEVLDEAATFARAAGDPLSAAKLTGALDAVCGSDGVRLTPHEMRGVAETRDTLKASLGEGGYASAYAAGRALSHADAVALARAVVGRLPEAPRTGGKL